MDKRKIENQRVKDRLLSALIMLLQEKDISEITVTALVAAAQVARASFYRNFALIEAIIAYGITQIIDSFEQKSKKLYWSFLNKEFLCGIFVHCKENAGHILTILDVNGGLLDAFNDYVISTSKKHQINAISRYDLCCYSGALYNVIFCWLKSGMKESPQTMANAFLSFAEITNKSVYSKL